MQIFVRGLGWDTYTIDIEPEDTILTLKHRVQDKTGIRSTLQRLIRLCCNMRLFSDTQERGLLAIPWDWTARPLWYRQAYGEHGYFLTIMLHAVDARLGEPPRAARTPAPNPDTVAARIRKRRKTPAPDPNSVTARVRKRRRS